MDYRMMRYLKGGLLLAESKSPPLILFLDGDAGRFPMPVGDDSAKLG